MIRLSVIRLACSPYALFLKSVMADPRVTGLSFHDRAAVLAKMWKALSMTARNNFSKAAKVATFPKVAVRPRKPRQVTKYNIFFREQYPTARGSSPALKVKYIAQQWNATKNSKK